MTVEEMKARMSHAELIDWMALDSMRAKEREEAERQASKGMKARR